MKLKTFALAALIAASATTAAMAQPYVAAGVAQTHVQAAGKHTATKSNVAVGYNLGKVGPVSTAVELDYASMGRHGLGNDRTSAMAVSAIAAYPITQSIDVFARAGVANVKTGSTSDVTNVVGLGATYKIDKNWSAGVEAKRYGPSLNTYGATVKYSF